ncbi:flavodoxin family protein [Geosporobacter ferrireducens]|uniref:Flavodoxin n=1 Tax=Geosporobacter ferrireducens TaxID=1424294 RepID=A0A1D8GN11_9FIRM|nr:flavodoxin family protein [Geosporobacter ferrireducens]AOT72309.1 flavodoxin [Geosporobacter ferrireducens]MTI56260.1 flavodoxin family protein [Geosporobacter ferrireducens]
MKVIAFNGSPRKNWNTATLLNHTLEGAASQGAETELIHLYDYNYKGCISCFACKLKGAKNYGKCAVNDDLKSILKKVEEVDAIILGSPIYFGMTTGEIRSFLERLMFQYLVYDANYTSLFKRKIQTGFIYTMNVNQSRIGELGYEQNLRGTEMAMKRIFGASESLFVTDTYQFDDYSKYETSGLNEVEKAKRRKAVFPEDCKKAFEMGVRFAQQSTLLK